MYLWQRPKSENWANLTPLSSATVCYGTEKSTGLGSSLALGLQRGVNSISLHCIPMSEVHVWPTSTDLQLSDFPVPASGSGSKVDQFVHVPTPVDAYNFIQIHARVFWVILLTDRQTNIADNRISPSLSEVINTCLSAVVNNILR